MEEIFNGRSEVISVTQPTGDDPSQQLMRQMIGIFDEYTSRENGKNVTRAMRESAKQGFWNGATPPLGYRIVEAERRGAKIKKKLEVDPVEAETVRLIFSLYTEGREATGPLGVKETCKWLNAHGHRTRRGSSFGVGPLHNILRNAVYATGKWPYGRRNARTGKLHDPQSIVEIDVPPIIPLAVFEKTKAKLTLNHPMVTAPRIVNSAILLTGLATCASCGSGMTRTGTQRRGKAYHYYTCAGCHQKGITVCKGRHIPESKLDHIVIDAVKAQLLKPERLTSILEALIERQGHKNAAIQERRASLIADLAQKDEKLGRLYKAIEEGIIALDEQLKTRITALKTERELIVASLARMAEQAMARTALTPARVEAFSALMNDKIERGDIIARKAYLRAVISEIRVDDYKIQIIGDKSTLAAAIAGQQTQPGKVSGFVRKWRTRQDSNL